MSFTSFGGSSSATNTKQTLMQQIQQEAAMSNARALVQAINQNCFEKCVPKPGSSLSSGEEKCFTMCMEKYMAAWNATAQAYTGRLRQEQMQRGGGGVDL